MLAVTEIHTRPDIAGPLSWTERASCRGRTDLFFPQVRERPERRARREAEARSVCASCPSLEPCRSWAREHREFGFWGGESEEERAAAGFRAAISGGERDWAAPAFRQAV